MNNYEMISEYISAGEYEKALGLLVEILKSEKLTDTYAIYAATLSNAFGDAKGYRDYIDKGLEINPFNYELTLMSGDTEEALRLCATQTGIDSDDYKIIREQFEVETGRSFDNVEEIALSEMCCGCHACKSICPVKAISIDTNEKGFSYPIVDIEKCIHCKKCRDICPILSHHIRTSSFEEIYVIKHIDEAQRLKSMSGGAFFALAKTFIENDGVVYGVALDDKFEVKYDRASTLNELEPMRQSKYAQVLLADTFEKIKDDIQNGEKVLFSGTPCNCQGLRNYLVDSKVDMDKLLLVDLICHGVPGRRIYKDYIDYLEKEYNKNIKEFKFRDKSLGWRSLRESYAFEDNNTIYDNKYYELFMSDLCLAESCYKCDYTRFERNTDITLGDFWGVENYAPRWDDNRGLSLCILRNNKAKVLFDKSVVQLEYSKINRDNCIQPSLLSPAQRPYEVDYFWNDYKKLPFRNALKKYARDSVDGVMEAATRVLLNNMDKWRIDWGEKIVRMGIRDLTLIGPQWLNDIVLSKIDNKDSINVIKIYSIVDGVIDKNIEFSEEDGYYIVTEETYMPEVIKYMIFMGIDLKRIVPISYVLTEEVFIEQ